MSESPAKLQAVWVNRDEQLAELIIGTNPDGSYRVALAEVGSHEPVEIVQEVATPTLAADCRTPFRRSILKLIANNLSLPR